MESRVSGVNVQAQGTVNLNSDYDATASFDTTTIELGPLIGSYLHGRTADVSGQTEVHGSLKGPLKFPERVDAHVDIPRLSLSYQSIQVASAAPLRMDYRNGTLTLDRAELKGTGTDLQLQGYIPIAGDGTLRATATGTMDLHIVQLLNPDIESSGQVKLDISAQGTHARPDIRGAVHIIDGAFQAPDAPLGAEKVNAEFEVQNGRVNIKSFTAQTGGGTVTAQGFATVQRQGIVLQVADKLNLSIAMEVGQVTESIVVFQLNDGPNPHSGFDRYGMRTVDGVWKTQSEIARLAKEVS